MSYFRFIGIFIIIFSYKLYAQSPTDIQGTFSSEQITIVIDSNLNFERYAVFKYNNERSYLYGTIKINKKRKRFYLNLKYPDSLKTRSEFFYTDSTEQNVYIILDNIPWEKNKLYPNTILIMGKKIYGVTETDSLPYYVLPIDSVKKHKMFHIEKAGVFVATESIEIPENCPNYVKLSIEDYNHYYDYYNIPNNYYVKNLKRPKVYLKQKSENVVYYKVTSFRKPLQVLIRANGSKIPFTPGQ